MDWRNITIIPITFAEGLSMMVKGETVYGKWLHDNRFVLEDMSEVAVKNLMHYQFYVMKELEEE